jgi:hypothetical protein
VGLIARRQYQSSSETRRARHRAAQAIAFRHNEGLSMPALHRIKIASAARGEYQTTGAVAIIASNPMRAAAVALLARGADPSDRLAGIFEANAISPVTLSRLAAPYRAPFSDHRAGTAGRNVD